MSGKINASIRIIFVFALMGMSGCASETDQQRRDREEKMRQDAANATERAKPAIEAAGKELGRVADRAAEDARAAAQGVQEGWAGAHLPLLDLNTARETDLAALPGITEHDARVMIQHRPYADKHELVTRKILRQNVYDKMSDRVIVK